MQNCMFSDRVAGAPGFGGHREGWLQGRICGGRTAYLLLLTLVTGLSTSAPPLSSNRRDGLHLARLRLAGSPGIGPNVAGGSRRG